MKVQVEDPGASATSFNWCQKPSLCDSAWQPATASPSSGADTQLIATHSSLSQPSAIAEIRHKLFSRWLKLIWRYIYNSFPEIAWMWGEVCGATHRFSISCSLHVTLLLGWGGEGWGRTRIIIVFSYNCVFHPTGNQKISQVLLPPQLVTWSKHCQHFLQRNCPGDWRLVATSSVMMIIACLWSKVSVIRSTTWHFLDFTNFHK